MNPLRAFFASMAGRIFLVLVFGVALSAAVAWGLADGKRQADLRRLDLERSADRVENVLAQWRSAPPAARAAFAVERSRGLRLARGDERIAGADPILSGLLKSRFPDLDVTADRAGTGACRPADEPGVTAPAERACWLVTAEETGNTLKLLVETPPRPRGDPLVRDPLYIGVLVLTVAVLALLVARMAAAPLSGLARAATELGADLAREPLSMEGPAEVRRAAAAFNAMQGRLQRQLSERTHMLAAITHDLQTPLTRLRLRLEKVEDTDLRERLVADLAAMQTLIREGLDLARAADHAEDKAVLDLRSMVESIVEDAADAGQPVTLGSTVEADVAVRPEALRRCLLNLVDNALKHGGSAELSIAHESGAPVVRVRDRGPGLPEERTQDVFEPFVRLEESRSRDTGGAGLGLTIARTLAEREGATIILRNHPHGGAEATIRFRKEVP